MATFETIAERAQDTPVISVLPPLASFYLDEFAIYRSLDSFHQRLYDPDFRFEQDVIIDEDTRHREYPRIDCSADPVIPSLNDVVDWDDREHHDRIRQDLLRQSNIKEHILERVSPEDFVALVIVDGLSYDAVRSFEFDIQPVVVDGISTTGPGFKRIIYGGDTLSVYGALTNKDFYNVYGFTYWPRGQEDLSTELHSAMGQEVYRIKDFDDALTRLKTDAPFDDKTYVQITRMGFDQECHNRKEEPNRNSVRDELASDIRSLVETAEEVATNYRIFVTADHGILWRDQLPEEPSIVHDEWADHARFLEGVHDLPNSMTEHDENEGEATALAYPHLTRELKNTEWGVHGGFSYQESIVPLIEISNTGDST